MADDTRADDTPSVVPAAPRELHVAFTALGRDESSVTGDAPAPVAETPGEDRPRAPSVAPLSPFAAIPGTERPPGRSWSLVPTPRAAPAPPPPTAPPPARRRRPWAGVGIAVASALAGAALALGIVAYLDDPPPASPPVTIVERVETRILTPAESGTPAAAVAERVLPSIVAVEVTSGDSGPFFVEGSGSGVVVSSDGRIVTNAHVVDGAGQVRVTFPDGRTYTADVIGEDSLTDLALLEIAAGNLTAIEVGSTDGLAIGDTAIAIGNPLGLSGGPSVTVGVVSAFDRRLQISPDSELYGLLQTDAPITRGSSGGALVDIEGRLIGITSAIGVSDVGAEGLGFAIPVELVSRIIDELAEFGVARHAFLGITGTTEFVDGDDGATVPGGVQISSVLSDSAADMAGIAPGDIILSFDGESVHTMEQLIVDLRSYSVGDVIEVELLRRSEAMTVPVTLMERPADQ